MFFINKLKFGFFLFKEILGEVYIFYVILIIWYVCYLLVVLFEGM